MSFTITRLTDHRAMVRGTDQFGNTGTTVVSTAQLDELEEARAHQEAHEIFDNAVEEFFAPLTEAAEAFAQSGKEADDPIATYVLQYEVEAVEGQQEIRIPLSRDSQIIFLIEHNEFDRLVWVNDSLEVLAYEGGDEDEDFGDDPGDVVENPMVDESEEG